MLFEEGDQTVATVRMMTSVPGGSIFIPFDTDKEMYTAKCLFVFCLCNFVFIVLPRDL